MKYPPYLNLQNFTNSIRDHIQNAKKSATAKKNKQKTHFQKNNIAKIGDIIKTKTSGKEDGLY